MNFDDGVRNFIVQDTNLLSEILYDEYELKYQDFKCLIELGSIYINNERAVKDGFVFQNSSLRVYLKPHRYNCHHNWKSLVVFENDFCLVLNKPSGIPSHPTVDNFIENALTQLSLAKKISLFVTHRLDTLTSGLIVYAKKQSFVKSFNIQLQERTISKKYVALVENSQKFPNRLTHYMNPSQGRPKELSDTPIENWPICELEILDQKTINTYMTWLKINLLTGRTHQIRAQLSTVNAPILGDKLYKSEQNFKKDAIALRSCEIEFNCNEQRLKFNISEEFDI